MTEPPTLRDMIKRTQELRQHLVHAQSELAQTEVTGTAGGGLVTVTMLGSGEVSSVRFDQVAVDEGDAEALAALTMTALRHATDAVKSLTTQRMGAVANGFDDALGRPRPRQLP
jgi:DNA-binding YbaB/EbfC family protein